MAPPKRDTTGVMVRLHAKTLAGLDDMIEKSGQSYSRPEMIRKILKKRLADEGYSVGEWVE
jgi:metal-responsive CopG/Arc/MetJ family transcriptional regulator